MDDHPEWAIVWTLVCFLSWIGFGVFLWILVH